MARSPSSLSTARLSFGAFDLDATETLDEVAASRAQNKALCAVVLTDAATRFASEPILREIVEKSHPLRLGRNQRAIIPVKCPAKPVIATLEGHTVADGVAVALWTNMRAVFGVFCRRFGMPMSDGLATRLPRAVGNGRAFGMLLNGRPVQAE